MAPLSHNALTHCPLMMPYDIRDLSSLVQLMVCCLFSAKPLPEPLLTTVIVNLILRNKVKCNFHQTTSFFIQENALECCLQNDGHFVWTWMWPTQVFDSTWKTRPSPRLLVTRALQHSSWVVCLHMCGLSLAHLRLCKQNKWISTV